MIISIAIADSNRNYLERLVEILQKNSELDISIFTTAEGLIEAIQKERYDVVLFDSDICSSKLLFSNVKLPICLYSDEAVNKDLYSDIDNIQKYQRISNIYKEILKKYADKAGYQATSEAMGNSGILAVYSPVGGIGKTTISLALSMLLTARGKKVLYLSTEQLSSSSFLLEYREEGNTALIEAFNSGAALGMKLKGIVKEGIGGVQYIEGFERIVDYEDTTRDEMKGLLTEIRKSGLYDWIIVDMHSHVNRVSKAVWEEADQIILISSSTELSKRKKEMFLEQAYFIDYQSKMLQIENKMTHTGKNITESSELGQIAYYGNLSDTQVIERIVSSQQLNVARFL